MIIQRRQVSLTHIRQRIVSYGLLGLVTIFVALPIVWLLISTIKRSVEYLTYPVVVFPKVVQWVNYAQVFQLLPFGRYASQTLFLATTSAVLTMITSSLAGFAFARIRAPGRKNLFSVVLALMIVPTIVTVIPQFVVFSKLHLTNTYWPWILWGLSASPFHIFLFRQFFAGVPKELEDAAEIDGCNIFRTFWQVFLPVAQPVMATSFIFTFTAVWGDWFTPMIYLSDRNTTLAVKLATAYVDPQGNTLVPTTLAACIIYILPMVIMFFFAQKYIMEGAIRSGLKG